MDELPLRFFRQIGQTVERVVEDHEARMHLPSPRRDALTAVPFPKMRIPDADMARMVEVLQTETDVTPWSVAQRFGYPPLVLERELPNYLARHKKWALSWPIA